MTVFERLTSVKVFHSSVDIALCVAFCGIIAFIVQLFTFAKSKFHFNSWPFVIKGEGNKGKTILLDFAKQFIYFLFVQKQLKCSCFKVYDKSCDVALYTLR